MRSTRVAEQHGSTPATVALAWLIARPSVTAPDCQRDFGEQLESLAAAVHLMLTGADIARLTGR